MLLLPQTLPIFPCATMVVAIARLDVSPSHLVLLGWIVTSSGVGLLAMLGVSTSVFYNVVLSLLPGLGIGILLPSLTLAAKCSSSDARVLQAQTLCIAFRYLGNAMGLVLVGIAFQLVLQHQLSFTKFSSEASHMTKHATTLALSVPTMSNAEEAEILTATIQRTLQTIWIAVTVTCSSVLLATSIIVMIMKIRQWPSAECPRLRLSLSVNTSSLS